MRTYESLHRFYHLTLYTAYSSKSGENVLGSVFKTISLDLQ